jgi:hypothetical protein
VSCHPLPCMFEQRTHAPHYLHIWFLVINVHK